MWCLALILALLRVSTYHLSMGVTVLFLMVLMVLTSQEVLSVVQGMSMEMALMISLLAQIMLTPMVMGMQGRVMWSLALVLGLLQV